MPGFRFLLFDYGSIAHGPRQLPFCRRAQAIRAAKFGSKFQRFVKPRDLAGEDAERIQLRPLESVT